MELTNKQWKRLAPVISSSTPKIDPRSRRPRNPRDVLNGLAVQMHQLKAYENKQSTWQIKNQVLG